MSKTVFDIDDIYALRLERESEYSAMTPEDASSLRAKRADNEWREIEKIRGLINDFHKCPNILTPQPDKLPAMEFIGKAERYK